MNNDLISREALKKAIKSYADDQYAENEYLGECAIMNIIDNAPTVEAKTKLIANVTFDKEQMEELVEKAKADILEEIKRPQGKWKLHGMIYYCSECGHECGESGDNFCGNCGADMRSEPCSHDCDTCEHGVPIDGQFYDDGLPIHECGYKSGGDT